MIEYLRSQRGKRIIQYVTIGLLVSMAAGSVIPPIMSWISGEGKESADVRVNGYPVPSQEVQRRAYLYGQQQEYLRQQFGEQADMILRMIGLDQDPRELARDKLTYEKLFYAYAQDAGIANIGTETLEGKLEDYSFMSQHFPLIARDVYNTHGYLDRNALKSQLMRMGMSYDDLLSQVKEALIGKLYYELVASCYYVPAYQTRAAYLRRYVPRRYTYATFDMQTYRDAVTQEGVTEQRMQEYFNNHKQAYRVPEKRRGIYWSFTPENYGIDITQEDIEAYYKKHKNTYRTQPPRLEIGHIFLKANEQQRDEVKEKAEELVTELQEHPKRFAQKARRMSDAQDAEQGGYIGEVTRNNQTYPKEMIRRAFQLEEDNTISDPIPVENGFEIVARLSKKEAEYQPLEDVAEDIRSTLQKQRFDNKFVTEAKQAVRRENKAEEKGEIQSFIKRHGGTQHKIEAVAEHEAQKPYEKALFNKLSRIDSYTYLFANGAGYIVQLTDIEPSYIPEMQDVQEQVKKDVVFMEAQQRMQRDLHEAYQRVYDDKATISSVAETYNASYATVQLDDEQDKQWQTLEQNGLPVSRMKNMIHQGYPIQHQGDQYGFLIVLSEIDPFDADAYEPYKERLDKELYTSGQESYTQAYTTSLYQAATIE